ncbi:MAG: amidohydrolase [Chloroflexi bacterium]|nr:amidohydrolase [Chloroflexota bacterium]
MRVLYNARIFTQDPARPAATAIAVDDRRAGGRILMTGSDQEVLGEFSSRAEAQDMNGKTIWPGLTDAHIHLQHYAFALQMIDCETATQAECLRRVAEKAAQTQPESWIRGHGWNQNNWPEGFGTVKELDAAAPNHPVYLTAKSLHAAWANSAALRAAGITRSTPDPQGGVIGRDENGNPNGLLFESAMDLVANAIPAPTQAEITRAVDSAQANLWQVGITGVHDYDRSECFTALQILQQEEKLLLRVVKSIPLEDLPHAAALGLRTGFGNDYLTVGSVKLFADGALGPRTAAMIQPYEGESGNTGILLLDNEQIYEYGQQASSNGISMAIHAIGDRANHEVLLAYTRLREYERANNLPSLRHRIEHVQLLHPDDYGALAKQDIIASVQPIHATSDMYTADHHWGKRAVGAYAFRTLIEQGTRLCFGSDAPVESPNPFLGIHAAVTRRRPDGSPSEEGWYSHQRLSLEEALQGFTVGPAYAAGLENKLGRLAPGFFADLIVLDIDPFTLPVEDLHCLKPSATMVGGEWVWKAA